MVAKPKVSCIIPAYNAEKFLLAAVESILSQSDGVLLDIIVVDDGSTDDTVRIASEFGEKIRIISQPNAGPAAARNRGIEASTGEYLALLDSDDLWHRDKLKLQLNAFSQHPMLEICAGHVQHFQGDMELSGKPVPGYSAEMLIRRTLFDRLGLFDVNLLHASELDWMLRARDANVAEWLLPETLVYRRLHLQNMSRLQSSESLKEHLRVLHALTKRRRSSVE